MAPKNEEIKEKDPLRSISLTPNDGVVPAQTDSVDNNVLVPVDTSSAPVDSLSMAKPIIDPALPDSVKTSPLEMSADSTK